MSTTTSRPATTTYLVNLTSDGIALLQYQMASTIWGETSLQYYFGNDTTLGLDIGFQNAFEDYYSGMPDATFAFSTQMIRAMQQIDRVFASDFTQTTNTGIADLVFVSSPNETTGGLEGFCQFPGSSNHPSGGTWSLGTFTSDNSLLNTVGETGGGEYLYWTLIHEVGHGLGLYHSFTSTTSLGVLDNERYTVMSYTGATEATTYGHAVTPMALDVAALQAMYGTEASATGNSFYSLLNAGGGALNLTEGDVSIGRAYYCVWDSAGNDTIDYGSSGARVMINLNDATLNRTSILSDVAPTITALTNSSYYALLSSAVQTEINNASYNAGGFFSSVLTGSGTLSRLDGGYTIAYGAQIENAVGGDQGDLLIGNELVNQLSGGAGDDVLIGGRGGDLLDGGDSTNDEAAYSGQRSEYTIIRNTNGSYTITHTGGSQADGSDTLTNIEYARFADQRLQLNLTGDTVNLNGAVDFVFVQDLTGSFTDDLPVVQAGLSQTLTDLQSQIANVAFGAGAFRDVGDTFIYQVRAAISTGRSGVESAYAGMIAADGGDEPEAQLTALRSATEGAGLNYRSGAERIVMIVTDASYHSYETISTLQSVLAANNAVPLFAVTSGVRSYYDALVAQLGVGTVVTLTSDSANLTDVVRAGVSLLAGDLTDYGTDGADVMNGSDYRTDRMLGGLGNDTMEGLAWNDRVDGGAGSDKLGGGVGADSVIGGTGNDTLFGDSEGDTLEGGAGDDMLIGDDSSEIALGVTLGSGQGNAGVTDAVPSSIASGANAVRMYGAFSLAADGNIQDATLMPHMSITRTNVSGLNYYSVQLAAGQTLYADIDATNSALSDSYLYLYNAAGTLVASDDDSGTSEGAGGSTNSYDSFLTFTASTAGTYYLQVRQFGSATLAAGTNYTLHVSQTGAAPVRSATGAAGSDLLLGGAGNDTLYGGGATDVMNGGIGNDRLFGNSGADVYALTRSDLVAGANDTMEAFNPGEGDIFRVMGGSTSEIGFSAGSGYWIFNVSAGTNVVNFASTAITYVEMFANATAATIANGSRTAFDLFGAATWSRYTNYFDGSEAADYQTGTNDDGTQWIHDWDQANTSDNAWYRNEFTGSYQMLRQVGQKDDGRTFESAYSGGSLYSTGWADGAGNQGWNSYTDFFDLTNGALDVQYGWYDNGTGWAHDYDQRNATSYAWYRNEFNSSFQMLRQLGQFDDGRAFDSAFSGGALYSTSWADGAGNQGWNSYTDFFDLQSGALDVQYGWYDNGTGWAHDYDQRNTSDNAWYRNEFTSGFQMLTQIGQKDDGRTWQASYSGGNLSSVYWVDNNNAHGWSNFTDTVGNYGSGQTIHRVGTNDNGSSFDYYL